jgi:hypothetical protein
MLDEGFDAALILHHDFPRLGAAQIPEWVRHRLLSLYQGSANDNVMKLVNLKRAIDDLEGRRIVLVGGAAIVFVVVRNARRPKLVASDDDRAVVAAAQQDADA